MYFLFFLVTFPSCSTSSLIACSLLISPFKYLSTTSLESSALQVFFFFGFCFSSVFLLSIFFSVSGEICSSLFSFPSNAALAFSSSSSSSFAFSTNSSLSSSLLFSFSSNAALVSLSSLSSLSAWSASSLFSITLSLALSSSLSLACASCNFLSFSCCFNCFFCFSVRFPVFALSLIGVDNCSCSDFSFLTPSFLGVFTFGNKAFWIFLNP